MATFLLIFEQDALNDEQLTAIRDRLPADYKFVHTTDEATIMSIADDVVIVGGWTRPNWYAQFPNLRWVQQWSAGADWLMRYPEIAAKPFVLTNASGVHTIQIGEHIFVLLLALGRNLPAAVRAQAAGLWADKGDESAEYHINSDMLFELAGKTMLLVGVGAIGSRTAQLAQAFGMRVIGMRSQPQIDDPHVDEMVGTDQLHAVLPSADVVVLTIPLTHTTRNFIGEQELALMRSSAVLINIGRGGTVDEDALARALQEGKLFGAGFDVFEEEPLPANSPLWGLKNMLITSHYAGMTPHYDLRALEILLDNLERFAAGQPLRNVVDKQAGY